MDILKQLLEKFDSESLAKLANFIGDPVDQVSKGVELSIGSLLNGLIHESKTNEGVEKVLKVIKDGGHSGDILDDLPSLLTNPDKTQLLITIGTNINNHFFGDNISSLSDKVAEFSDIKKTSASSIVSFAAPLVLGFLGKQVKSQRLNPSSFGHFMREEENSVKGVLPPSLATLFSGKSNETSQPLSLEKEKVATTSTRRKSASKKEGNSLGILAWILLGGLMLAAAYYAFKDKLNGISSTSDNTEMVDSLSQNTTSDTLMQDDSFASDSQSLSDAGILDSEKSQKNGVSESFDQKASNTAKNSDFGISNNASNETRNNSSNESSSLERASNSSSSNNAKESFKSYAPVVSQFGSSGDWAHFGANYFKRNSAELRNQSEVEKLANYLNQNPNQTLKISGLGQKRLIEDRAYALREALYLKGIPLARMVIEKGPESDGGSVRLTVN